MTQPASKLTPETGGSWGLFGGAFDPVHLGHLALARDMTKSQHLSGILFIPSFDPPHRKEPCFAPFDQRLDMLQVALAEHPAYDVSTVEAEMAEPSYTLNVVRTLKKRYPATRFHLILGADNLAKFSSWYRPDEILKEIDLLVGARPGFDKPLPLPAPIERVTYVSASLVDVSSSQIRKFVAAGASLGQLTALVPGVVAEMIITRGLYR
ncbi:MAG: nicotinate (nicotinamide) nucleotide adenylyltransferase [Candidatus Zixiibacteriota bacterium]